MDDNKKTPPGNSEVPPQAHTGSTWGNGTWQQQPSLPLRPRYSPTCPVTIKATGLCTHEETSACTTCLREAHHLSATNHPLWLPCKCTEQGAPAAEGRQQPRVPVATSDDNAADLGVLAWAAKTTTSLAQHIDEAIGRIQEAGRAGAHVISDDDVWVINEAGELLDHVVPYMTNSQGGFSIDGVNVAGTMRRTPPWSSYREPTDVDRAVANSAESAAARRSIDNIRTSVVMRLGGRRRKQELQEQKRAYEEQVRAYEEKIRLLEARGTREEGGYQPLPSPYDHQIRADPRAEAGLQELQQRQQQQQQQQQAARPLSSDYPEQAFPLGLPLTEGQRVEAFKQLMEAAELRHRERQEQQQQQQQQQRQQQPGDHPSPTIPAPPSRPRSETSTRTLAADSIRPPSPGSSPEGGWTDTDIDWETFRAEFF